jgi:hypothetical protein
MLYRHGQFRFPMTYGVIQSFEDMEQIWSHTFYNVLKVDPQDFPVVLTEAPLNPREKRMKTVRLTEAPLNPREKRMKTVRFLTEAPLNPREKRMKTVRLTVRAPLNPREKRMKTVRE